MEVTKVKLYLYQITNCVETRARLRAFAEHLSLNSHPDTHYTQRLFSHKIKCFNRASSGNGILAIHLIANSGFGGLEVACWPLVPKLAGSHPAEAVGFLGVKIPQHAFLRRGSKAAGPMS
jgi:hypothetical protein